jgi:hypothetical protein
VTQNPGPRNKQPLLHQILLESPASELTAGCLVPRRSSHEAGRPAGVSFRDGSSPIAHLNTATGLRRTPSYGTGICKRNASQPEDRRLGGGGHVLRRRPSRSDGISMPVTSRRLLGMEATVPTTSASPIRPRARRVVL